MQLYLLLRVRTFPKDLDEREARIPVPLPTELLSTIRELLERGRGEKSGTMNDFTVLQTRKLCPVSLQDRGRTEGKYMERRGSFIPNEVNFNRRIRRILNDFEFEMDKEVSHSTNAKVSELKQTIENRSLKLNIRTKITRKVSKCRASFRPTVQRKVRYFHLESINRLMPKEDYGPPKVYVHDTKITEKREKASLFLNELLSPIEYDTVKCE